LIHGHRITGIDPALEAREESKRRACGKETAIDSQFAIGSKIG